MNKLLLSTLVLFVGTFAIGQSQSIQLNFDTKYYNAVDKWIAFPKIEADTSYILGFIYLDDTAGFTFNYETRFIETENGLKKLPRIIEAGIKSRLAPSTMDVAILNDKQLEDLDLPKVPEWLANYKGNEETVTYLKNIGFHYNDVGASNLAVEPLTKAYKIEPHFEGLEFELAYAYNALNQFEKAIPILEKAIENDSKNFTFYRELGFAFKNLNQIEKAETVYRKGIKLTEDKYQQSEMAINMAQAYYNLKNLEKFKEWAELTRKYSEKDSEFIGMITKWESELRKE